MVTTTEVWESKQNVLGSWLKEIGGYKSSDRQRIDQRIHSYHTEMTLYCNVKAASHLQYNPLQDVSQGKSRGECEKRSHVKIFEKGQSVSNWQTKKD